MPLSPVWLLAQPVGLLPMIGGMALEQIGRETLMTALLPVDASGKFELVRNLRAWAGQIFERAIERGYCQHNPAALIRPERAFGKRQTQHLAALELHQVRAFMHRLALEGNTQSAVMCRLMALTWVRTGVLRRMMWSEVDGDIWRIPGAKMKMRKDLLVPLSKQATEILKMMRQRRTTSAFVFPHPTRADRPASENSVLSLLYRMEYKGKMTGHGWRSVGSTWANENGFDADAIERQLAHVPKDEVRATYNRAQYLTQRRELLQAWADWLLAEDVDAVGDQR